jgi:hypothetical protein
MPDQVLQDRKHARLNLAHPSAASQLALRWVELEGVEPILDPVPTAYIHPANFAQQAEQATQGAARNRTAPIATR